MFVIQNVKHCLGKQYRKLKTKIRDFKLSYFPRNSFKPIKLTRSKYNSIKMSVEQYCERIIEEIKQTKNSFDFNYKKPTILLNEFEVVSRIGDYLGPVILYNGKYYRCIKKESLQRFNNLWESGILQVFDKKGYIPHIEISDFYTEEYPIILEQETIKIVKLKEISLDKSKKAALFISILQYICRKSGCVLLDPHFYNFTIDNDKFIYYDLGSFYMTDNIERYNEFSLVIMGMYRILFAYFPDSVLSRQELGFFRYDAEKYAYTCNLHEFSFYRRKALKYHCWHSSKIVNQAFKNIFMKMLCSPWDIIICFMDKERNNIESLLEEIL